MGHGPDQWSGASSSPTGGVDQNFGGVSQSSSTQNPTDLNADDYVSSVDTMGLRAQTMNKSNLFVTTHYAGGSVLWFTVQKNRLNKGIGQLSGPSVFQTIHYCRYRYESLHRVSVKVRETNTYPMVSKE